MYTSPCFLAPLPPTQEDMHVHSTFSDGKSSVAENVDEAVALGLRRICCVDHVRVDTPWVPSFVRAVRAQARRAPGLRLEVCVGVEAKILDESGALDMPPRDPDVDFVLVADHQFPVGDRFLSPGAVRRGIAEGTLRADRLIEGLVRATRNAVERHDRVIVAHLFSILPKVGLDESQVRDSQIADLAFCVAQRGALVEVSEKWRCPSPRVVRALRAAGAGILASTDSHARHTIGRYSPETLSTLAQRTRSIDVAV
jgi:putative hydrolase